MIREFVKKNALLLLVLLVVVSVPSVYAYNYVTNDPKFCTTCHLMNSAYDTWNVSAMHDLNCHTCHESDMLTNVKHLTSVLVTNPGEVAEPVVIDNQLCQECHANNDPKWIQIADTTGHKVHLVNNAETADCVDCHGQRLHEFRPIEDVCVTCHTADKQIAEETMGAHCATCHEFLAPSGDLIPGESKCQSCHEGKETMGISFPNNAHTSSDCLSCHNPHEESIFPNCTNCHTSGGGLHQESAHVNCISCHKPHDGEQLRENCVSCHPDKSDHYPSKICQDCHSFTG